MKKILFILSSVVLSGLVFDGCKKGEGDPAISFRSRAGRVAGDWTVASGTQTSTTVQGNTDDKTVTEWSGETVKVTYTDNKNSTTYSGTGTGTFTVKFTKDGTWESVEKSTVIMTIAPSVTYTVATDRTKSGTWNFTGKVGESKNKSQIILYTLKETNVDVSNPNKKTDVDEYTADDAPSEIWNLYQLKNKEMIIKWDGKSVMASTTGTTTNTSTTTDVGEMTLTQ